MSHQQRRVRRPGVPRRFLIALVTAAVGVATALTGGQPADAAAPWLAVSDGFASFNVPAADLQNAMGEVSGVVVEADFGPSFNVSELGLVRRGGVWTSVIGPLPPGVYRYRLRGDDTKIVKDPPGGAPRTRGGRWSHAFRTAVVPEGAHPLPQPRPATP